MVPRTPLGAALLLGLLLPAAPAPGAPLFEEHFINYTGTNTPPAGWSDFSDGGVGVDSSQSAFWQSQSNILPYSPDGDIYYVRSFAQETDGEGLAITLSGLGIGETYEVSFYTASSSAGGLVEGFWDVFIDAAPIGASAVAPIGSELTWVHNALQFTASATGVDLGFRGRSTSASVSANALLDAVSVSMVPEPGALALAACALAGFAPLRGRRRGGYPRPGSGRVSSSQPAQGVPARVARTSS